MTPFRWAIFGTGAISAKFVAGLAQLPDSRVTLVGSREQASGAQFAARFGIAEAVAGTEAAVARARDVADAVYIATPPALHRDHAIACLDAGLPVLIEKPFAADAASAEAIAAAARASGSFCMEGMWARFMPAFERLRALVEAGAIGEPRQVTGSFGISNAVDPAFGNFDAARGGGAPAHLGIYPLSLAQALFGEAVEARAIGRIGETGVEEEAAVLVRYPSGVIGSFQSSLRSPQDGFAVHGTHGTIRLAGPLYRPWGVVREGTAPRDAPTALSNGDLRREGHGRQRLAQLRAAWRGRAGSSERHFYAGNGYHYEAAEVAACVRAGRRESAVMPLADSVVLAGLVDRLRSQIRDAA